jgi:hypothetical protein
VFGVTGGDAAERRSTTINFLGKSGKSYCFQAWPLGTVLRAVGGGIYIFTARECVDRTFPTKASHRCLAVGRTPNLAAPMLTKAELAKIVAQGANCLCVYPVGAESDRLAIEKDLIEGNERCGHGLQYLFDRVVPPRPPGGTSPPS